MFYSTADLAISVYPRIPVVTLQAGDAAAAARVPCWNAYVFYQRVAREVSPSVADDVRLFSRTSRRCRNCDGSRRVTATLSAPAARQLVRILHSDRDVLRSPTFYCLPYRNRSRLWSSSAKVVSVNLHGPRPTDACPTRAAIAVIQSVGRSVDQAIHTADVERTAVDLLQRGDMRIDRSRSVVDWRRPAVRSAAVVGRRVVGDDQ